jgi:hypothetical protein
MARRPRTADDVFDGRWTMRSSRGCVSLAALSIAFGLSLPAQAEELSPKARSLVASFKSAAEGKNQVNRTQQGSFYFKWLQGPPVGWDKSYFKLGELVKGTHFLSLQLIRNTPQGVEMLVLNDAQLDLAVEEAFRGTGKTLADADKNIAYNTDKAKVPVTPEMASWFASMLDQLRWELKVPK